jgi:hypothetical protein
VFFGRGALREEKGADRGGSKQYFIRRLQIAARCPLGSNRWNSTNYDFEPTV